MWAGRRSLAISALVIGSYLAMFPFDAPLANTHGGAVVLAPTPRGNCDASRMHSPRQNVA